MEYCEYPLHAWSHYRHFLRNQCPRKAWLYYQEARKGADPAESAPEARIVHGLRRRITLEQYISRMFDREIRKIFYAPDDGDISLETLCNTLNTKFDRELELMLGGIPAKDHNLYMLKEFENKNCNLSQLISQAGNLITQYCSAAEKELWKLICDTSIICRREIASPLTVYINELCCYCAPLLALERNGVLWIVENHCRDTSVLLHKFYAVNTLGREPHLVRSFSYCRENGNFQEAGLDLNVSETLRQISEDGALWSDLLAAPWQNVPSNSGHCPDCEFNFFCNQYRKTEITR